MYKTTEDNLFVRYNVPALLEEETYEVTRFETPDYEAEVRYFPRDHRVEVESEEVRGLQDEEEMEEVFEEMNLEFEAEEYGDVAYEFIEVYLDKDSGMWLEDDVGDKVLQII